MCLLSKWVIWYSEHGRIWHWIVPMTLLQLHAIVSTRNITNSRLWNNFLQTVVDPFHIWFSSQVPFHIVNILLSRILWSNLLIQHEIWVLLSILICLQTHFPQNTNNIVRPLIHKILNWLQWCEQCIAHQSDDAHLTTNFSIYGGFSVAFDFHLKQKQAGILL